MTRLDYSTRTRVPIFIWVPILVWVLIHGKPLHAGEVGAYIHGGLILICICAYYPESTVLCDNPNTLLLFKAVHVA